MKKILIITISLLLFNVVNAQTKLTKSQKKLRRKAVSTIVWDVSGESHQGYLYSADSSSLTITNSYLADTSLTKVLFRDIYRIKLLKKDGFGKAFGRNSMISGGIVLGTSSALILLGNDDVRLTGLISILVDFFFGAPINAMITTMDKDVVNIDFINNLGESEDFALNQKFLTKYSVKNDSNSIVNIKNISVIQNNDNISRITKPSKKYSPKTTSLLHFTLLYDQNFNDLSSQFVSILSNSDYPQYIWTGASQKDIGMSGFLKASCSVTSNVRPYFSFTGNTKNFSSSYGFQNSDLDISFNNFQYALGTDYVFLPVNRMFTNKFEILVGAGLAMHSINTWTLFDREFPFKKERYSIFGLNMNASVEYYFSRRLSFSVVGGYNLMPNKLLNDISYFSSTEQRVLEVKNININTSNYHIGMGISIHILN